LGAEHAFDHPSQAGRGLGQLVDYWLSASWRNKSSAAGRSQSCCGPG
jgi:hypothetical protein